MPELLHRPGRELVAAKEWASLVTAWAGSDAGAGVLHPPAGLRAEAYWLRVKNALEQLVALAGGWRGAKTDRQAAYDSETTCRLRGRRQALWEMKTLVHRGLGGAAVGSWPYALRRQAGRLAELGVHLEGMPLAGLGSHLSELLRATAGELQEVARRERWERLQRWQDTLPRLWREEPGVVYRWAQGDAPQWGSARVEGANGSV